MAVADRLPPLATLYVYLTSGCNCACRHCWIVPEAAANASALAPSILRRAVEQALPLGLQALKWTGGEPTIHPEFAACLALQKEYGLTASLETNGMLLDDRLAGLLQDAGVTDVSVSLDGAQAVTHDAIRGVTGGFARTCAGIGALVAAGYRPELILTLQRANAGELDRFLDLAGALGAGQVKLNILQPVLRGAELARTGAGLSVAELVALARRFDSAPAGQAPPVMLDIPLAFRPLGQLFTGGYGVCGIHQILGIIPDGLYALCGIGQHHPELVLGRVADVSLTEVWREHPLLVRIRNGLPGELQGVCRSCLMKAVCMGSCIAASYHHAGDLFAPNWFCQAAAEAGLFPGTRQR